MQCSTPWHAFLSHCGATKRPHDFEAKNSFWLQRSVKKIWGPISNICSYRILLKWMRWPRVAPQSVPRTLTYPNFALFITHEFTVFRFWLHYDPQNPRWSVGPKFPIVRSSSTIPELTYPITWIHSEASKRLYHAVLDTSKNAVLERNKALPI